MSFTYYRHVRSPHVDAQSNISGLFWHNHYWANPWNWSLDHFNDIQLKQVEADLGEEEIVLREVEVDFGDVVVLLEEVKVVLGEVEVVLGEVDVFLGEVDILMEK